MSASWDPGQYLRYGGERGRPFADLLCRIVHPGPRRVVDLGCGPGNTTSKLLERWPNARVTGIDHSPDMIDHANSLAVPDRLDFRVEDLRDWKADAPVDVLMCCATLQWVPGHVDLLPDLIASLAPGGVFAFQVPANFQQPSHILLNELATSDRWGDRLGHLARPSPVLEPAGYLETLLATGADSDVWETTYQHLLVGPDAVMEWARGTALRPYLAVLEEPGGGEDDAGEFLTAYSASLRAAYPRDAAGRTLFPFRRIFGIATVAGHTGELSP
ncbi:MAG: methyltransferase domain-containing protein [Acidimicrobiales bacterium]